MRISLVGAIATSSLTALATICLVAVPAQVAHAEDRTFAEVVNAGGQQQWVSCAGSGSPTVVLATGLRTEATQWGSLPRALQQVSRTCIYDRPGLGRSPARLGNSTVSAADHAAELHEVLNEIGETEPVVLVGNGYAASLIRAYANNFDVAGAVIMDGIYPAMHRNYLPSFRSPWNDAGSQIDMKVSEEATKGVRLLGVSPLIVLTSESFDPGTPAWAQKRWTRQQRKSAELSSNSLWISVPRAAQKMWQSHPQSVINAVRSVVNATIDGSDLQCEFNWKAANGVCAQVS